MIHTLRPYQQKGENDIRDAYRNGFRAPLYVLPTGGGKTHVFTDISSKISKRNKRSLIVVHRSYLWEQASKKITELGERHGILAPGHTQTKDLIQVGNIQTISNRLDKIPYPDEIIFDEAHHVQKNNMYGKLVNAFPESRILGVTATPGRTNGSGLGINSGGYFDTLIEGPQTYELIDWGDLSRYKYYGPDIGANDVSSIPKRLGDFNTNFLTEKMIKPKIIGSVPGHYMKICPGVPAIAFCASVAHSEKTAMEFRAHGIPSASVSGKTPPDRRKFLFRSLAYGAIKVLCSCDLISEGFDVPVCGAAILLRHTMSEILFLQQCGRCLRVAPGKDFAYILDCVGNHERHKYPATPRIWSLDGIKKTITGTNTDQDIAIRTCPKCFNVHRVLPICPECGYLYQSTDRIPLTAEGKLIEIENLENQKRQEKQDNRAKIYQAGSLPDLYRVAQELGYNRKWVKHRMKAILKREAKKRTMTLEKLIENAEKKFICPTEWAEDAWYSVVGEVLV